MIGGGFQNKPPTARTPDNPLNWSNTQTILLSSGVMSQEGSPVLNPVLISEDLTPLPSLKAAGDARIDFDGQLSEPLRYHEDVRTGCGGQTWPAGLVLGKHMLRYHRSEMRDARILELGAGGGLVGLAVALGCGGSSSRLLVTDQQQMLELMETNIRLNHIENRAKALVLNWGEQLPEDVVTQKPNVILAAECVYFEPAFPLLMQTLKDLLILNNDATVFFCFKKRRRADMQFIKMAKKAFHVVEIFDEDRPVFQRQALFLFTFRSRKGTVNSSPEDKGGNNQPPAGTATPSGAERAADCG